MHVVHSHLPPEKTDIILNHLATLAGNSYEPILAYGGTAKNFDATRYARKILSQITNCVAFDTYSHSFPLWMR